MIISSKLTTYRKLVRLPSNQLTKSPSQVTEPNQRDAMDAGANHPVSISFQ